MTLSRAFSAFLGGGRTDSPVDLPLHQVAFLIFHALTFDGGAEAVRRRRPNTFALPSTNHRYTSGFSEINVAAVAVAAMRRERGRVTNSVAKGSSFARELLMTWNSNLSCTLSEAALRPQYLSFCNVADVHFILNSTVPRMYVSVWEKEIGGRGEGDVVNVQRMGWRIHNYALAQVRFKMASMTAAMLP